MKIYSFKYLLIITAVFLSAYIPIFANTQPASAQQKLAALERSFDGKIGIYAVNTANHQTIEYRAQERFPIQSTFKLIVVSSMLKKAMTDPHLLQEKIHYGQQDIVVWSPITEKHVTKGMTLSELGSAAMMYSDNTATNLIMKKLRGPEGVTRFARSIGDPTFRIDHWEPELNSNPNDIHDTSTPEAMGKDLQRLALGNDLSPALRDQLVRWMKDNTTGDTRIRAGAPKGWIVADKTGSGTYGIANDVGIVWPPNCAPIVLAIYSVQDKKEAPRRDDIVASAARIVLEAFSKTDQCIQLKTNS